MTRYLIVEMAYPHCELQPMDVDAIYSGQELTPQRFIESSEWGIEPEATAEQVVEAYENRCNYMFYKNKNKFFPSEYKYHPIEHTSPYAEWVVYREIDNGDLLCISGVRAECVSSEVEMCSACGALNPESQHSCRSNDE